MTRQSAKIKYRQVHNIASIPLTLSFEPVDAADRAEKMETIAAADIFTRESDKLAIYFAVRRTIPNLRPSLSEIHPNESMPTTVPFAAIVWSNVTFC